MTYHIVLSPDAEADIDSAVLWYYREDPRLAVRFTRATLAMRRRIEQFPYQFTMIRDGVRRASLKQFPYYIYYSFHGTEVMVLAVVHQRRANRVWMDRATNWIRG
jgi:plasmid stabilization system protein ParE